MLESIGYAIAGGALIGLSASILLLTGGHIAGISGVFGGILQKPLVTFDKDRWRPAFFLGLLAGGLILRIIAPEVVSAPNSRGMLAVIIAGLLVGFGTRLGNGCTSGHGVCGITRFSRRSLMATLIFMATGFITATLMGVLS